MQCTSDMASKTDGKIAGSKTTESLAAASGSATVGRGPAGGTTAAAANKSIPDDQRYAKQEKIGKGSFGDVYKG